MVDEKPEFIIAKTHLTCEIDERAIILENYNHYATIANSTITGGVILYFEKRWEVKEYLRKLLNQKFG